MIKDKKLSKINNRDVYKGKDGNYYSVDTQHGHFKKVSPLGKHLGEVDLNLNSTKPADLSGSHDIKVK